MEDSINTNQYELCGTVANAEKKNGIIRIICAHPITGRYVKITTTDPVLTLCEVQVMGVPVSGKLTKKVLYMILS